MTRSLLALICLLASCAPAQPPANTPVPSPPPEAKPPASLSISISFPASLREQPASGRLILYLLRDGARVPPGAGPADGPFWGDPQPMFGIDIANLAAGTPAIIDDRATAFPSPLSSLPKGKYTAQTVLDLARDDSSWRREPGNLFSEPVPIELADGPISLALSRAIEPRRARNAPGLNELSIPSPLLSAFRGRPVSLRAAVLLPLDFDPSANRQYAAIYHIPGFGGDHTDAFRAAAARAGRRLTPIELDLARNAFHVFLDPESPNGHTLFADSANNGPCGQALTTELIPALEAKYPLAKSHMARLVTGHSSGGWSSLWLAITYPDTFGACWSSAPDPVDFRRFQLGNIYEQPNFYEAPGDDGTPHDVPSLRRAGRPIMTVRQENLMEEVLGSRNTSAQQWDSWLAAFGPRAPDGNPADLFNPLTGIIDHAVAEHFRAFDIDARLKAETGTIGLILYQRVRLVVGDQDSFYLNEAVSLLKKDLEEINFFQFPEGQHGSITIVPDADHGTVFRSDAVRAFPSQMLDHLKRHKLIPE
ncbi:MAG: alpha/beta hydrolase-fold protein [Phycisphaerales bacterium]